MKPVVVAFCLLLAPLTALWALSTGRLTGPMQVLQPLPFAWPAIAVAAWIVLAAVFGLRPANRAGTRPWSTASKAFHWIMALAVLSTTALMYYIANLGDLVADPAARAEYGRLLQLHKSLGLVVLFLVAFRFAWNRLRQRPPLPAASTRSQRLAVQVAHGSLYALMLVVPLLGWTASMTYGGKTRFFGLFELPVWLPKDVGWANLLQPAHIWLAWAMLALVGVHLAAALWHHFLRRDATLVQMLPDTGRD
jgi:cytochrome b561